MLLEEGVSEKKHRDLLSSEVQRIVGTAAESFQYVGEVSTIGNFSDDKEEFLPPLGQARLSVSLFHFCTFSQVSDVFTFIRSAML